MTTIKGLLAQGGARVSAPRDRRILTILGLAAVAAMLLPGSALGARFGASMSLAPSSLGPMGETCNATGDPEPCTMFAVGVGMGPLSGPITAPFRGRITRIRLRADHPGSFRIQLGRIDDRTKIEPGEERGRVTRSGRVISFEGSAPPDPPESFRLRLPVRKGEYLVMRSTAFPFETCGASMRNSAFWNPPLPVGGPFVPVFDNGNCTPLVQAIVKHVRRHRH